MTNNNRQRVRYPELPRNFSNDELQRKWSELIRALNERDSLPPSLTYVFGRQVEIGGASLTSFEFVTAGSGGVGSSLPTSAYWYRYDFQIPNDVGFVFIEQPGSVASPNCQVVCKLPKAAGVQHREIQVVTGADVSDGAGNTIGFNLGVEVVSGDVVIDRRSVSAASDARFTAVAYRDYWLLTS